MGKLGMEVAIMSTSDMKEVLNIVKGYEKWQDLDIVVTPNGTNTALSGGHIIVSGKFTLDIKLFVYPKNVLTDIRVYKSDKRVKASDVSVGGKKFTSEVRSVLRKALKDKLNEIRENYEWQC